MKFQFPRIFQSSCKLCQDYDNEEKSLWDIKMSSKQEERIKEN